MTFVELHPAIYDSTKATYIESTKRLYVRPSCIRMIEPANIQGVFIVFLTGGKQLFTLDDPVDIEQMIVEARERAKNA